MSTAVVSTDAPNIALPEGWQWVQIGDPDVSEINPRDKALREIPDDCLVSFVPMPAVDAKAGRIVDAQDRPIGEVRKGFTNFANGDVIFAKITPCMENGKAAIVRGMTNGIGFGSTEFYVIRPTEAVLAEWIFHFIRQERYRSDAKAAFSGAVGQQRVPKSFIADTWIPLPPIDIQREIVAQLESRLSRLDKAVADLRSAETKLKRHRAATLAAATSGRLVPTEAALAQQQGRDYEPASVLLQRILAERRRRWEDDQLAAFAKKGTTPRDDRWKAKYQEPVAPDTTNLPELPEGWVWASLDQLLIEPLINGRSVKDAKDGFPVLRLTAIRSGIILRGEHKIGAWAEDQATPFLINAGDFLIARGNGSIKLVGRGGLVIDKGLPVAFPDTMIRARPNLAAVNPAYLAHVWDSVHVRSYIESNARTTAGIYKVNQSILGLVPIPLPSPVEQERIVNLINNTGSMVDALYGSQSKALLRSGSLRSAILQQAFHPQRLTEGARDGDR